MLFYMICVAQTYLPLIKYDASEISAHEILKAPQVLILLLPDVHKGMYSAGLTAQAI